MLSNIIDRIRLPFRKDKELYLSLRQIIGFYPHDISYYKLALMHKSMYKRNAKGKPVNNERLEFLGDAILDATVGDIVYRHFPGKREGFLTNTRSKLVQRENLEVNAHTVFLAPFDELALEVHFLVSNLIDVNHLCQNAIAHELHACVVATVEVNGTYKRLEGVATHIRIVRL